MTAPEDDLEADASGDDALVEATDNTVPLEDADLGDAGQDPVGEDDVEDDDEDPS